MHWLTPADLGDQAKVKYNKLHEGHVAKGILGSQDLNSSPPGQNGRHFADNIFKCIVVYEKFFLFFVKISWKFVPKDSIIQRWFR